jgi:hypothetical protein
MMTDTFFILALFVGVVFAGGSTTAATDSTTH